MGSKTRLTAIESQLCAALEALVAWGEDVGWDNTGEPKEFEEAREVLKKARGES